MCYLNTPETFLISEQQSNLPNFSPLGFFQSIFQSHEVPSLHAAPIAGGIFVAAVSNCWTKSALRWLALIPLTNMPLGMVALWSWKKIAVEDVEIGVFFGSLQEGWVFVGLVLYRYK